MHEKLGSTLKAPLAEEQKFDLAGLCRYSSELSPQPMLAVEGTTHIVRYLNPAFSRLVGKSVEELIGRPFAEVLPEGPENGCLALFDRVYQSGTAEVLVEQHHSQTPLVYWSYSVWAIQGTNSCPVGVMIQVTDATEVVLFREKVVEMNEHLLVSSTRQHELTEAAEKTNRIKDDFLATLSHELRTPLTAIVGWADMLGNSRITRADTLQAIDVIQRNARIQVRMINDLLDVARIVAGKLRLNLGPIDLSIVILAAVDTLRPLIKGKEIDFALQLDPLTAPVMGDADRLQQVVWNLLSNAIKFTPKGGRVAVSLDCVGSQAELKVQDTGIGMATEFLPHVFDRFLQEDATNTRTVGGLGLGLSIVRQLVELHGGTISVDSRGPGLGSTFVVQLPLLSTHTAGMTAASLHQVAQGPADIKDVRVLVVDDKADTCEILQAVLESHGAQVECVDSASAAMESIAQAPFDVLLCDIGMPNEDGYSLISRVRALGEDQGGKVPAAALTAYVSEQDRALALELGFQIHIAKPSSPREIIAVVANLAGRTG
jgi:PAS domain S-box-containing protein